MVQTVGAGARLNLGASTPPEFPGGWQVPGAPGAWTVLHCFPRSIRGSRCCSNEIVALQVITLYHSAAPQIHFIRKNSEKLYSCDRWHLIYLFECQSLRSKWPRWPVLSQAEARALFHCPTWVAASHAQGPLAGNWIESGAAKTQIMLSVTVAFTCHAVVWHEDEGWGRRRQVLF